MAEGIKYLYILIIWQSLLFAVVLFSNKFSKKYSNRFLAMTLLTIGLHFSLIFFYGNNYIEFGKFKFPIYSFGFIYGPLIYFYVRFSLRKDLYFKESTIFHFIPFIGIIVLSNTLSKVPSFFIFSRLPLIFGYCLFGFIEVFKYRKIISQTASKKSSHETNLFFLLLIITIYNSSVSIIINLLNQSDNIIFGNQSIPLIILLGVLIFVNLIVYLGISKPQYFRQISKEDITIVANKSSNNLTPKLEELKPLSLKIDKFIKESKIYTDPELDLSSLANVLEIHPKLLSQSINRVTGNNFSEYINSYRIEDVKTFLRNKSHSEFSIKEIMYEVGFTSRSVFNTLFKKKTGMTPSEYRSKFNSSF